MSSDTEAKTARPRGLWNSLTPEQQERALSYEGDENHGDPAFARQPIRSASPTDTAGRPIPGLIVLDIASKTYEAFTDLTKTVSLGEFREWSDAKHALVAHWDNLDVWESGV